MGLATIVKLLPQGGTGKAFYLLDFLREHASLVAEDVGVGKDLPVELTEMIIAPLSTCPVLPTRKRSRATKTTDRYQRTKYNHCNYNHNHNHNHNHGHSCSHNNSSCHNSYKQKQEMRRRDRCQQSVRAIVDDVVYSLVQTREKLRCKRQHEQRHSFRRKRKRKRNTNNDTSHHTDTVLCGANALIHGFGVSREGDNNPPKGMKFGITYQRPNENVTFCKSSPVIKKLHELVGDEVLRMMLMHTRVFLPIRKHTTCNDCNDGNDGNDTKSSCKSCVDSYNYILLCGPPLIFESNRTQRTIANNTTVSNPPQPPPPQPQPQTTTTTTTTTIQNDTNRNYDQSKTKKKQKRKRSFPTSLAQDSPLAANQTISRFSLMYCDVYIPRVTLPKSHPFSQRLLKQRQAQTEMTMDDFTFVLNVVFELHLENKNKQRRIRKRLKEMGRMVCERLLKNYHSYHNYGRLLTKYCPLPRVYNDWTASPPSSNENKDQCLEDLAHAYTCKENIVSFLAAVLRGVFPSEFWGTESNFQSVLESIRSFVSLRRQEKLANKNIMHGISVTAMKWLYPSCTNATTTSNSPTEDGKKQKQTQKQKRKRKQNHGKQRTNHEAATELTLQALRWVFNGFIIPLLRSCFYVTETEFAARELHYYRKPVWSLFRALSLQKITMASATGKEKHSNDQQHPGHPNQNHFRQLLDHPKALQSLQKQKLGVSRLRFLPKATGMRPIAQLSRTLRFALPMGKKKELQTPTQLLKSKPKRSRIENDCQANLPPTKKPKIYENDIVDPSPSLSTEHTAVRFDTPISSPWSYLPSSYSRLPTNSILENVLDVLTYECDQRQRPYGNGLGNLHEFYARYRDYMLQFRRPRTANNNTNDASKTISPVKFYFAKVDIEKCYDRIHSDYLLELVQEILSNNSYVVQTMKMNHANLSSSGDNAQRYKKIVDAIGDYQSFHRREHSMARETQNTVFELLKCSLVEKEQVRKLLREHLLQHIVVATGRYAPKLLLQTRGISQGSALSTLLCNLYYGRVEKLMKLGDHRNTTMPLGKDLISRYVDDFLFVTPDDASFREFLDKTHRGKPELGAKINPNKTLVNAQASVTISLDEKKTKSVALSRSNKIMNNGRHFFPWCGFLFDTATGEVAVDYDRFRGGKLVRSLTIDADGREGEMLARRLEAFLFPRCLPILFDASINSFSTIVMNFYQMMLLGACKTREYIMGLNAIMKRPRYTIHNTCFLLNCISGLSRYAIKNIRSKAMHCAGGKANDGNADGGLDPRCAIGVNPKIAFALSLKAFAEVFSYSLGFDKFAFLLRQKTMASLKDIPKKVRYELRITTARAFDDFRINTMIKK